MVPALQGRGGWTGPSDTVSGLGAGAAALQLVQAMRARHPHAGAGFLAVRTWAGLLWQPVYAGVLAVELTGDVLPLAALTWDIDLDGAEVSGVAVPARRMHASAPGAGRTLAAAEIAGLVALLLPAVQACTSLHAKAARRWLADCTLAALLRAQPTAGLDNAALRAAGIDWLLRLGLPGESGFLTYAGSDGAPRLALDRRVCCLDDRRSGGDRCDNCPRRVVRGRRARLHAATWAAPGH